MNYYDCNGIERSINLEYQTIGWFFYMDEMVYKLMHWAVTCIFVFTCIRLGYLFEIEKIINDYREKIQSDRRPGMLPQMSHEKIQQLSSQTEAKLEQHEKRGKSNNNTALIFCVTVAVLIAAIYFSIIIVKNLDDNLTNKQGVITSCMQIPVYLVLFLTLTGTLI